MHSLKLNSTEPRIWWKHGVIYHIYPRSFQDTNGDGIGDIRGIIRRLGYLKSLGIEGIWLSPMYKSPMADFGYDVSSYREIDPVFGSNEDFRELLEKAHESGIHIILDMILNHTSNQHPWFIEASSSLYNPKRNWYIWKEGTMGSLPNNWKSAVGGSAWKLDEKTGQYYLHSFFEEQPDLNWRDPEMPQVFFEEMKYWLDLGVDGFRFDVINLIAKDKKFRNNPSFFGITALQKHVYTRNRKRSVTIGKKIRELLDRYENKVSIGEVYVLPPGDTKTAARYLTDGETGLHLTFDFSLIFTKWNAYSYYKCIDSWYGSLPEGGWPCQVLSNHDLFRNIDRLPWQTNKEEKAKVAAGLLLTLKGTPFIYYGEEIGMHNTHVPKKRIVDPLGKRFWPIFSGRDKARTPMQWNREINGGFTTVEPWLPLNRDYHCRNVRQQEGDPTSLLSLYRNLIMLRRSSVALQQGSWVPVSKGKDGILAYFRIYCEEQILVILNFTGKDKIFTLAGHFYGQVMLSTHKSPGEYNYLQDLCVARFEVTIYLVRDSNDH